jgi:hypothetical protein
MHTGATHLARRPEEEDPTCRRERLRPRWQVLVEAARASSLWRRMGKRVRAGFSEALIGWAVMAGLYSAQLDILLDGPYGPLCLLRVAVVVRSRLHRTGGSGLQLFPRTRSPSSSFPSSCGEAAARDCLPPPLEGSAPRLLRDFLPVLYAARVSPTDCSRSALRAVVVFVALIRGCRELFQGSEGAGLASPRCSPGSLGWGRGSFARLEPRGELVGIFSFPRAPLPPSQLLDIAQE